MLSSTCGEAALNERTCREWFERFKTGDFDVENWHGGGKENIFEDSELKALLAENWCQMQEEFVEMLNGVSLLVNSCLKRQNRKGFLHRVLTSNEKWVHYDNPNRRKSWGMPGHAFKSTARPNIHGVKVMLCIW